MKKHLSTVLPKFAAGTLAVVLLMAGTAIAEKPGIEGTYRLVSRELPDGTIKTAPDVTGLLTFTKTHRNLQVIWKGANDILCSYSLAATYSLTSGQYKEKVLFSSLNDYTNGEKIAFDLVKRNHTVKVVDASASTAPPPIDQPTMIIDGKRITASAEGMFIDTWEKIEESGGTQASNPE